MPLCVKATIRPPPPTSSMLTTENATHSSDSTRPSTTASKAARSVSDRHPTVRRPQAVLPASTVRTVPVMHRRSEEHTSELQSQSNLVCRLLLEKKNTEEPIASLPGIDISSLIL